MPNDNQDEYIRITRVMQPRSRDLRGRQSVRATFKLSPKAIETLSVVSVHLGIKQKSLFDHLIDDDQSLEFIAGNIAKDAMRSLERVQKTYVLSRKTLNCLEKAAQMSGAPRDALVEFSIQRLLPLIEKERERHERRKKVFKRLKNHLGKREALLHQARKELGADDPICERMEAMLAADLREYHNIADFIKKSAVIEDF